MKCGNFILGSMKKIAKLIGEKTQDEKKIMTFLSIMKLYVRVPGRICVPI